MNTWTGFLILNVVVIVIQTFCSFAFFWCLVLNSGTDVKLFNLENGDLEV